MSAPAAALKSCWRGLTEKGLLPEPVHESGIGERFSGFRQGWSTVGYTAFRYQEGDCDSFCCRSGVPGHVLIAPADASRHRNGLDCDDLAFTLATFPSRHANVTVAQWKRTGP